MSIKIEHVGGVGANTRYDVVVNGVVMAKIARYHVGVWHLTSTYYSHVLSRAASIEAIKLQAERTTYPTASEVYEHLCEGVRKARVAYVEREQGPALTKLAREIIAGSNSARFELEHLIGVMDRFVLDRTDTVKAASARVDAHNATIKLEGLAWRDRAASGWRYLNNTESYPYYPDAPADRYPDAPASIAAVA